MIRIVFKDPGMHSKSVDASSDGIRWHLDREADARLYTQATIYVGSRPILDLWRDLASPNWQHIRPPQDEKSR